eukprot:119260_1
MSLFLSIVSPYVLSYSSGIKLFIYRKTFDDLVGFNNIFLMLYLLPSGFLYFVLLDIIDILLSIWLWVLHNILCRNEQYLKELQEIIAKQLGMDRMNFEGFKRQKSISQILFETIPQTILQTLLMLEVIPGRKLAGITNPELQVSIVSAVFNLCMQITKLYIESVAVEELFVEYNLNAMMGRVSWIPFRFKLIKMSRNIAFKNDNTLRKRRGKSFCGKLFSPLAERTDGEINYHIRHRIPLISYFSDDKILNTVDYDFSSVTIGHLIATVNQLPSSADKSIKIRFHKSLKLLGVKEIINLMEVCKRKNILLPDISQSVDWTNAFSISSTINKNDPRLSSFCRDYNDRPLLISMYMTQYDEDNSMLISFLDNDCPINLKDSNDETIIYHMIRNYDYNALNIVFQKLNQNNTEINNLNTYNKAGISPLYLALQCDFKNRGVKPSAPPEAIQKVRASPPKDIDIPKQTEDVQLWQTNLITIARTEKFQYQTVCDIIRFKLNCDFLKVLRQIQANSKMIHSVFQSIYGQDTDEKTESIMQQFTSHCNDAKITEIVKQFVGPFDNHLSPFAEDYYNANFQEIITTIKTEQLRENDKRAKQFIARYIPTLTEPRRMQSHAAVGRSIQSSPTPFMYQLLLHNNADINFSCLDANNNNNERLSCLVYILTNFLESTQCMYVIRRLLDQNASIFGTETGILAQLFVNIASKDRGESNAYLNVLDDIAKQSHISLQNVIDESGNNPIHIAIIHSNMFKDKDEIDTEKHLRVLSTLCTRYPYWTKAKNFAGDYPLYSAIRHKDLDATFCLLSYLSKTDAVAMNNMLKQKVFVEVMISWVVDGLFVQNESNTDEEKKEGTESETTATNDIAIMTILLDTFGYQEAFAWPNVSNLNEHEAPITLMQYISNKDQEQQTHLMNVLMKQCNIEHYIQSDEIFQIKEANEQKQQRRMKREIDRPGGKNVADSQEMKDDPIEDEEEIIQTKTDTKTEIVVQPKEKEPVSWIELFYSLLVESFSTADLYTDIIIMMQLFKAKQQWWVSFMSFFLISPYLVSYSALGSIIQHRIQAYFLHLNDSNERLNCCKWATFNIIILILMTPLCLGYFIAIDVIFMIYVLFSTFLFLVSCTKIDIRNFVDDILFKKIFGMNRTQIVGYRRLRTLSQLFFESIPQIGLQFRILWSIKWSNDPIDYEISETNIMWSIIFAILHLILEASIIYLDSRALKMEFIKYAIVCLGARVGWIPYNHLIEHHITTKSEDREYRKDITSDMVTVYDYENIQASLMSAKYKFEYNFSNESLSTFSQTLGSILPKSLPPIFYSSKLCNPFLESLLKNAMIPVKIKFGRMACRDIDTFTLAEFYQATINKVHIDIESVDGMRVIRNNDNKSCNAVISDNLIAFGLVTCADWMKSIDFDTKVRMKRHILMNALQPKLDMKYSRFDILRICHKHCDNSFYIALDCKSIKTVYNYLNEYFIEATNDASYYYVIIFLLYYTRGTILNHKCCLGCCDANTFSQNIVLKRLNHYIPNNVNIQGKYSIPFALLECFNVFNLYVEELLLNLCKNAIILGKSTKEDIETVTVMLKSDQTASKINKIIQEFDASYCDKLFALINNQNVDLELDDIKALDAITTAFEMTEFYNIYLHRSFAFRAEPEINSISLNKTIELNHQNRVESVEIVLPTLSRNSVQVNQFTLHLDDVKMDEEDAIQCRIYFHYKNMKLNTMLFYDKTLDTDQKEIAINLQSKGSALAYYNRHLVTFNETYWERINSDANPLQLQPIMVELSGHLKSKSSIHISLKHVSYSLFTLNKFQDDKDELITAQSTLFAASSVAVDDFELLKVIGRGSFGKVLQVRKKDTGEVFAMKVYSKKAIIAKNQVDHTMAERKILQALQHPFLMQLRFAFQNESKLYFVMTYYSGGELFFHLRKKRRFTEQEAQFMVAETSLALGHLHSLDVVYRDVKPENMLLDDAGHICLTDFGLAKDLGPGEDTTHTFCGVPEYLAPEIVMSIGHGKAVDWWSMGILLYELTVGIPPFYSQNINEMYRKIQEAPLLFPPNLSNPVKDLIIKLLQRDPKKRLGFEQDVKEITTHPFFKTIDWDSLYRKEIDPPYKPKVNGIDDFSNFDTMFTKEAAVDSYKEPPKAMQKNPFADFDYAPI